MILNTNYLILNKLWNTKHYKLILKESFYFRSSKISREKLTKKNAKKVAKAFVPTLTSEDADTFIEKNARLCEFYPEIMEAFLVTIKDYEQYVVRSGLSKVRTEMKGGGKNGNN